MKKYLSKKLPKSELAAYAKWCKQYDIDPTTSKLMTKVKPVGSVNKHPQLNFTISERMQKQREFKSVDSGITGATYSKSMMDPLQWRGEDQSVIDAIKHKATCIAPAFSKGAYQYVSAGTDPSDLGKKK